MIGKLTMTAEFDWTIAVQGSFIYELYWEQQQYLLFVKKATYNDIKVITKNVYKIFAFPWPVSR